MDCTDWGIEGMQAERYQMTNKAQSANDIQVGGSFYKDMDVEPWEACEAWGTKEQFTGYLLFSAVAYLARYNVQEEGKGGLKDVKKAHHYLTKLIETLEE